ncbi:MAG: hypothetical protein K6B46_02280 [Opitutales bacterium]|nr:hypothetical protein [Opitutales bacterium]
MFSKLFDCVKKAWGPPDEPLPLAFKRLAWILMLGGYFILLYVLYKSIWAWNIFD